MSLQSSESSQRLSGALPTSCRWIAGVDVVSEGIVNDDAELNTGLDLREIDGGMFLGVQMKCLEFGTRLKRGEIGS